MLGNLAKWFSTSPSPDSRPLQDAKAKTEIEVLDAQRKEAEAKAAAVLKEAEAKAAAVLKEAQAKAAAVLKEAEARTKEAQAKAKAEIELLDAQRKEAQAKAAAVLKEAEAKAALTLAPIVVGCAAAAFIGLDWLLFGCRPMLRWRMKRHLRALSRSPRYEIRNDIFAHDKLYERLECPELPIIFIGPSGSGKTTCLQGFTSWFATSKNRDLDPRLTVYISVRSGMEVPQRNNVASKGGVTAQDNPPETSLDQAARNILSCLGYPKRPPYIDTIPWLSRTLPNPWYRVTQRVIDAIDDLFIVLEEESKRRRARGVSRMDATSLVVFDEFADLSLSEGIREKGGGRILHYIGLLGLRLLVNSPPDHHYAKIILTGSNYFILKALAESRLTVSRVNLFEHSDAPRDKVEALLQRHGYSHKEIDEIISVCGSRLRLIFRNFVLARPESISDQLATICGISRNLIADMIFECDEKERQRLFRIFDNLVEKGFTDIQWIPVSLRDSPSIRSVFYLSGPFFTFQDESFKYAWKTKRDEIIDPFTASLRAPASASTNYA